VELPLGGEHMVINAVAAAACACALYVPLELIAAGLATVEAVGGRQQILAGRFGGRLIDDSYNANPGSMRAAIDLLVAQPEQSVFIMGDMGELGSDTAALHRSVGEYARRQGVTRMWACGRLSHAAIEGYGQQGQWFASKEELLAFAEAELTADQVVLVKGSRSAAMDDVIAALRPCSEVV
jgi:UDP-N-acetylmuramoyl-tripeptide--D-alanyl-D-alanine ligase